MMKFDLPIDNSSIIKVIGVGGGGSNAINHMFKQGIKGVDFIVCNTDSQALQSSSVPNKIQLGVNLTEGLGTGFIYPRTDSSLLSRPRHDDYNVAGIGISAKAGLNITFFKHFFIQTELKAGYINMFNIRTTFDTSDKATQTILFFERTIAFGGIFRL